MKILTEMRDSGMSKTKWMITVIIGIPFILIGYLFLVMYPWESVLETSCVKAQTENVISGSDATLKKYSKNKETYKYLKRNKGKHLTKMTDNQYGGHLFYNSGLWGRKTIGVTGTIQQNKLGSLFFPYKLKQIYLN
ncbi:hypothetical protein [Fructilactobacillus fructivorans]|nr:hypothetical protein [Fructilactobacillus fructivorans]